MVSTYQSKRVTPGFAAIGIGIVIAVIVVAGALGYVFYQKSTKQTADATSTKNTAATAQPGTMSSIDQLTTQDAATESGVDSSADTAATTDATSADDAINNLGSAYDENSF